MVNIMSFFFFLIKRKDVWDIGDDQQEGWLVLSSIWM